MFKQCRTGKCDTAKVTVEKLAKECQTTNSSSPPFAIVTIIVALLLLFTQPWIIEYITQSFFILTPQSFLTQLWVISPVPIVTEIYLFNWTNPFNFFDVTEKPKFEEVGPYRFIQTIEKVNLTWNLNDTVTFKRLRTFHYDDQMPNGNISDQVISLNIIPWLVVDQIKDWNIILKRTASSIVSFVSPEIYLRATAKDFIYDGIDDLFMFFAHLLPFLWSSVPRYERIGILSVANNSVDIDGVFNAATGINGNINIQIWNYHNTTPFFKNCCGIVRGTLGEFYDRSLPKEFITLFVPDLCRYVKFEYSKEVKIKGILGYKYIVGNHILDNGTIIAENKCFCNGKCIPSGMLGLDSCRYGFPFYVSMPHFYQADPVYLAEVGGLKPDEEKHEGYIVVEPVTGIPLSVSVGMQLNVLLHPVDEVRMYEDVRTIFFPLFWMKMSATIPNIYALVLKIFLSLPWILTGISLSFLCVAFYWVVVKGRRGTQMYSTMLIQERCRKYDSDRSLSEKVLLDSERTEYHNII